MPGGFVLRQWQDATWFSVSNGLRCGQLAVTVGLRYVATPVFSSQTSPAVYDRRAIRREKLAG
jgi:hypothetical protein